MSNFVVPWSRRKGPKAANVFRPGWLRSVVFAPGLLQGPSCLLVILSAADLFMTYALLRASPTVYESNPLAQWCFARWNMAGMVGYKFGLIAGVIVLAEIIERHRPRWGKSILHLGSAGAAYAFVYGVRVLLGFSGHLPDLSE